MVGLRRYEWKVTHVDDDGERIGGVGHARSRRSAYRQMRRVVELAKAAEARWEQVTIRTVWEQA